MLICMIAHDHSSFCLYILDSSNSKLRPLDHTSSWIANSSPRRDASMGTSRPITLLTSPGHRPRYRSWGNAGAPTQRDIRQLKDTTRLAARPGRSWESSNEWKGDSCVQFLFICNKCLIPILDAFFNITNGPFQCTHHRISSNLVAYPKCHMQGISCIFICNIPAFLINLNIPYVEHLGIGPLTPSGNWKTLLSKQQSFKLSCGYGSKSWMPKNGWFYNRHDSKLVVPKCQPYLGCHPPKQNTAKPRIEYLELSSILARPQRNMLLQFTNNSITVVEITENSHKYPTWRLVVRTYTVSRALRSLFAITQVVGLVEELRSLVSP